MVTTEKNRTTTTEREEAPRGQPLARLAGELLLWRRRARSRSELSRLGDRALADLGTLRADIPRFARERDPWQRLPGEAAFVLALGRSSVPRRGARAAASRPGSIAS
jgi:uncharacterized protein YjiS (DUF1127 family)